jgi:hypothetical protein
MLFLRPGFTDTLRHMVPATTPYREFTAAGGLMSYVCLSERLPQRYRLPRV